MMAETNKSVLQKPLLFLLGFFLEASDKKRWDKHCLSLKSILNLIIPVVFYRHQVKNWIPVVKTLKTKIYLCWDQLNRETRFTFITSWEQLGQYHFNELEASWSLGQMKGQALFQLEIKIKGIRKIEKLDV